VTRRPCPASVRSASAVTVACAPRASQCAHVLAGLDAGTRP
jgi:hypothetical protein